MSNPSLLQPSLLQPSLSQHPQFETLSSIQDPNMTTNTNTTVSPKSLTTGPWVVVSPVSRDLFRISASNHLLTRHQPDTKPQPVDKQIGEWTHVERTQQEEEEEEWEQVKSVSDTPALLDKSVPQARSLIR